MSRPVGLWDLPVAKRREIEAALGRHPSARKAQVAAPAAPAGHLRAPSARWRCHHCGEPFTAWAKAERHRHPGAAGGEVGVIDLVLR